MTDRCQTGLMIQCYRIAFSFGLDEKIYKSYIFLRTFDFFRRIYKEKANL